MFYFLRFKMNDKPEKFSFLLAFLLLITSGFYTQLSAQQRDKVDFLKISGTIVPLQDQAKIEGTLKITFEALRDTDSIYMDAVNFKILETTTDSINISAASSKVWLTSNFEKGEKYSLEIAYEVFPEQTVYFFKDQIWTQGQGKYTSHWLPSIDDVNDKIEFDLSFLVPKNKTLIANGKLMALDSTPNKTLWTYNMESPMSSYLVAFAVGDFDKKNLVSKSGIPIELYYSPSDSLKVEPTYRHSKTIFDFLEAEIGISYPWQNYKQVPVRDFLYAGMENTTATFFSQAFMVDSIGFHDRNYVNVNAHELAHQWFGNLITEESSADHWLQEGFATYYALLAEREVFGEEYYYWQLYQTAEQLKEASDAGKGESLVDPKASSLTFYQKGAWALHILREKVGEEAFKKAIKNYLEHYQFKNVSTQDFLNEVKAVTANDLSEFEKNWLYQSAFRAEEAYQSLLKSPFIKEYFEISSLRALPLKEKKFQLKTALTFPNDFIGQEAAYQLGQEPISEAIPLYKKAFESNNLYVRQAIALSLQTIPKELQHEFESLLNDSSYVTLEAALYQLYMQFPENRKQYLDRTEGIEGFQNKNIRQLWLALALIAEDYNNSEKTDYLNELKTYTSPEFSFEIREKAFEYMAQLNLWDSITLKNLVEACVHPTWRFAKQSKKMLAEVLQKEAYHQMIPFVKSEASDEAVNFLNSILK